MLGQERLCYLTKFRRILVSKQSHMKGVDSWERRTFDKISMARLTAGSLRSYFELVASKLVQDSEVNPDSSNSHEFNGTNELKDFLGRTPFGRYKRLRSRFLYFSDEQEQPLGSEAELTWYKPHSDAKRTEWRMYYDDNPIVGKTGKALAGDLMVFVFSLDAANVPEIAKKEPAPEGQPVVWVLIAQQGSVAEREIMRLFGIEGEKSERLETHEPPVEDVDVIGRQVLDGLGIKIRLPDDDWRERLMTQFGNKMPNVVTFSNFAMSTLEIDFINDPDGALVSWWEREDLLFRIHDRALMRAPLEAAMRKAKNVEDIDVEQLRALFMSSAQKARSRAGAAFEHQLETIFLKNSVRFDAQGKTASGDIPDFLFPSLADYEKSPLVDHLTMLAAKTTCKERWTQVLQEAPRIPRKHLATMSPAIPPEQLSRMRHANLTLVLPESRHDALPISSVLVMTLKSFITLVRDRQAKFE